MITLKYINVNNLARIELGISLNEYVVCEMVYHLSSNPDSPVKGWCSMSRSMMAENIGVSKQSIINLVSALCEKKLLKKNRNGNLKTTGLWYKKVVIQIGKESLPNEQKEGKKSGKESLPESVKKVYQFGKESLPYINIDINKDINISSTTTTGEPNFEKKTEENSTPDLKSNPKEEKVAAAVDVETLTEEQKVNLIVSAINREGAFYTNQAKMVCMRKGIDFEEQIQDYAMFVMLETKFPILKKDESDFQKRFWASCKKFEKSTFVKSQGQVRNGFEVDPITGVEFKAPKETVPMFKI